MKKLTESAMHPTTEQGFLLAVRHSECELKILTTVDIFAKL